MRVSRNGDLGEKTIGTEKDGESIPMPIVGNRWFLSGVFRLFGALHCVEPNRSSSRSDSIANDLSLVEPSIDACA